MIRCKRELEDCSGGERLHSSDSVFNNWRQLRSSVMDDLFLILVQPHNGTRMCLEAQSTTMLKGIDKNPWFATTIIGCNSLLMVLVTHIRVFIFHCFSSSHKYSWVAINGSKQDSAGNQQFFHNSHSIWSIFNKISDFDDVYTL